MEEGGELLFLPSTAESTRRGGVCLIKMCLKINIRRIYLFCDEEEQENKRKFVKKGGFRNCWCSFVAEVPCWENPRPHKTQKSAAEKEALYIFIFIISILKTNYFFFPVEKGAEDGGELGGEEEGWRFLPLFCLCFLSSLLLIFQQM